jgi:hypothetical protein
VILLLALVACPKTSLQGETLTALAAVPPTGEACPGEAVDFGVSVTLADGSTLGTPALQGKHVAWRNFAFEARGGRVDPPGTFRLEPDARATWDAPAQVTVVPATTDPGVNGVLVVRPRYDCAFAAAVGGVWGIAGVDGRKGAVGEAAGSAGENGRPGQDGQHGGDAPDVEVAITRVRAPLRGDVLQVEVVSRESTPRIGFYAVDVDAGTLTIDARGGAGGDGGRGGDGGDGATGTDSTHPGRGGDGGLGADGGNGGRGAHVVVHVDPSAEVWLQRVVIDNRGGNGGMAGTGGGAGHPDANPGDHGRDGQAGADGPAVDILVERVPALW